MDEDHSSPAHCTCPVLAKLEGVRQTGSGWTARCPAHDDEHASLSVSVGDDGRTLLFCHAGCPVETIVQKIGWTLRDLMPSHNGSNGDGKAEIVTRYDYRDESGVLLFQVVRFHPKDFRQRRPKPGGGWEWSVKGVRVVPYRLPELLADPEALVFIPEGEKDVDRLHSLGLVATCNAGGAGKWRGEHAAFLNGRRVVVLPDNDDAGRKHARKVAESLLGKAASIKVLELDGLPEKGDVSDWLDASGSAEELLGLVQAAPNASSKKQPAILPWRPFPVNALPEPARAFVKAGSKAIGCDPSYIALPLLAALASAIGATRRIELKPGWTEPAVLWTAVVGESGTLKSPGVSLALRALWRLQAWRLEEYPELMEQHQRNLLLYDADLAAWKRQGRAKGEPPPEKPVEPQVQRYIVNDITVEALAERLQHAPRGLLSANDELGAWLGSFDQYRANRGSDTSRWLSIHRAESLLVDRKTGAVKTTFVKRAAVSITGGIPPRPLARALGNKHLEDGLAARLLFALPPRQQKRWTEAVVEDEVIRRMEVVFGRLLALDFGRDDTDAAIPVDVKMTPEAKLAWVEFYNRHAERQGELVGALAAAAAKTEGATARLALVFHLVAQAAGDTTSDEIDEITMTAAITLGEWFTGEAERVYAGLAESDEEADTRRLVELIGRKGGSVTARDLQQASRAYRGSVDVAEEALDGLVKAGFGQWQAVETGPRGGRPTRVFVLREGVYGNTTPETPGK